MDWLRIDNTDVGYLCLGLLAWATAAYLLSVRRKSRGTWWLTGVAVSLAFHLLVTLVLSVLNLAVVGAAGPVLFGLDAMFLALSAVAAVGFAHEFLVVRPPTPGRWPVGLALAATAALAVVFAATLMGGGARSRLPVGGAHAFAALAYLWSSGVLLYRARRNSGGGESPRRALRAYAALMPVGAFVAAVGYAVRFTGVQEYVFWLALLVLLLGLITLYVNHAPEPSSLQAKVVAFVLASALTALAGAVALGNRPDDLARSSGAQTPAHEALQLLPDEAGGYRVGPAGANLGGLGAQVEDGDVWSGAEIDLGFDFPFGGQSWTAMRVFPTGYVSFGGNAGGVLSDAAPTIAPLYAPPSAGEWDSERIYVRRETGRIVVTWLAVTSAVAGEHATFHLVLERTGAISLHYGDIGFARSVVRAILPLGAGPTTLRVRESGPLPDVVPPGGVLQTVPAAYDAHTSRRLLPWVWLAFGVTGGVLIGLPLLLRASVTRPLDRLLDGVRRVEGGDLSAEVAVEARDEVGRLSAHFNQMTAALREANDGLQAYAETLEDRVEERTEELAASNADLAAEKAELSRALEDLQRAQAQLVQQEKLVALGRLTSGIAHEIKNPLNFVVNFSDLNQEILGDLLAHADARPDTRLADVRDDLGDLRGNAERVSEHGRRADGIVRAMMDHAQGGTEAVQPIDLNALVEEHVGLAVGGRGDGPPPHVARDYGADVGVVAVTPRGLGRVVLNLVSNALDAVAGRDGAPLTSGSAADVTVRTRREGGRVQVVVSDRGIGVAPDALAKLFEPFYTTKPTGRGNVGLGLSLSRDVVVSHGGTLEVQSVEGEGATFTVTLPAG